jgi:hypothetical protein
MRGRALIIATSLFRDPQLSTLRSPRIDAAGLKETLCDSRIGDFQVTDCLDSTCEAVTQRAIHALASAYLDKARQAAVASHSADVERWLQEAYAGASAAEIDGVRREIAQRQRALESARYLGLFHDRLRDGKLSEPAQDSAVYYLGQLQSSDPGNTQLSQATHDLAAKLLDRARGIINTGKGNAQADADVSLAKRFCR